MVVRINEEEVWIIIINRGLGEDKQIILPENAYFVQADNRTESNRVIKYSLL